MASGPRIVFLTSHDISGARIANELLVAGEVAGIFIQNSKRPTLKKVMEGFSGSGGIVPLIMKFWSFLGFQVGLRGHLSRLDENIKIALGKMEFAQRRHFFIGPDLPEWRSGVPVFYVDDINDPEVVSKVRSREPDIIVVVGGRILKGPIIAIPSIGVVNLHTGMLPWYRGSCSEFWALYNGEPEKVGATVHFIDEGLDSGDIILQERLPLYEKDTLESIHWRNMEFGAEKLVEAIKLISIGKAARLPQDPESACLYKAPTDDERRELSSRLPMELKKSYGQ